MHSTWIFAALSALIAVSACRSSAEPTTTRSRATSVGDRELPEVARSVLLPGMEGHAEDMNLLFWSVLFLDRQGTEQLADGIASGPRLARPNADSADSLNAQVPEAFYVLQDELATQAANLRAVAAAPESDGVMIANAYGVLTATCVKCHQQFFQKKGQ